MLSFIGMVSIVLRKLSYFSFNDGDNAPGRVFKKDWWKFLGFLIT